MPTITAAAVAAMGGVTGDPVTFRATWAGHAWNAAKVGDTVHLSRTCTGCWSDRYPGMWSTARHTVQTDIDIDVIGALAARAQRLRAKGEHEMADAADARAFRILPS